MGYCLDVLDLFMAKAAANRDKDREFDIALMRHGYVVPEAALALVESMPVDDNARKAMRARIRRWVRLLEERGHSLPR